MTTSKDGMIGQMASVGLPTPRQKVLIKLPESKEVLKRTLGMFVENPVWLPEYDHVAEWLSGNNGRGLFLFGSCGRGKSVLCRYVIPAILLSCFQKVVSVYDMQEVNRDVDGVLSKHIISLDDVGTEEVSVKYGEKRLAFAEVMDAAEKYGKLVIVSTNLTFDDLRIRYGDRVVDRIRATTFRIPFNGKSLRQ